MDSDGSQDEIPPAHLTVTKNEANHMNVEDFGTLTIDENPHACLRADNEHIMVYTPKSNLPFKPDFTKLFPFFSWAAVDHICATICFTMQ